MERHRVHVGRGCCARPVSLHRRRLLAVNERGDRLRERLNTSFTAADMPLWATGVGSMVCIRSTEDRLVELPFHAALDDGLYIARRGFTALSQ